MSVRPHSNPWIHPEGADSARYASEILPYNAHLSWDWFSRVICSDFEVEVSSLVFPDPSNFVAGQVNNRLQVWSRIAETSNYPLRDTVLDWLENKVQVHQYFRRFKGEYFDSAPPPRRHFANHPSCAPFDKFINDTILERLATRAIPL